MASSARVHIDRDGVAVEGGPGPDLVLVQSGSTGHRFPATMIRAARVTGRPSGAWQ
jgi:hypothetical protein